MGKARSYFYKDAQGNIQKYFYCNMCPGDSQPFTADQEYNPTTKEGLFIIQGKHIIYCIPCAKILGLLRPPEQYPIRTYAGHKSYVGPRNKKSK